MVGALSDLKIVELGEMVSAPYAAKLMADMGAEVVKVEPPPVGDRSRTRGPFPGGEAHPDKSGLFLYLNANKCGVTLDIAGRRLRDFREAGCGRRRPDSQYRAARDGSHADLASSGCSASTPRW